MVTDTAREQEQDRPASLLNFAEQMVKEAEKAGEEIRKDAKSQSRKIIEAAERDAKGKHDDIVASAGQEAQQLLKKARKQAEDIMQDAERKADDRRSRADLDAELTVRNLTAQVSDEISSTVLRLLQSKGMAVEPPQNGAGGTNGSAGETVPEPERTVAKGSKKQ